MDRIDPYTNDINKEYLKQIKKILPEVFTEVGGEEKVDIDKLLNILGVDMTDDFEKYEFKWKGKTESLKLAGKRSTGTLRPCVEESVDWDKTQNLYIEGDNLEVLKLLQRGYHNAVKMIYIDPPFNTGQDFVYEDDFADNLANYKEVTLQQLRNNPETAGRFHTKWLNMIYPRLRIAKTLLTDDGVIFISIDDNEITNLRKVCDEVFGEDNFIGCISVQSNPRGRQSDSFLASVHDYLLIYCRNINDCKINGAPLTDKQKAEYSMMDSVGAYRLLGLRQRGSASRREDRPDMFFPIYVDLDTKEVYLQKKDNCAEVYPRKSDGSDGRWMWGKEKCKNDINRLVARLIERRDEYDIFVKDYLIREDEERTSKYKTIWDDKRYNTQSGTQEVKSYFNNKEYFPYPKSVNLLLDICRMGSFFNETDIILDFFSGSATTAQAVMQLNAEDGGNRRFICVQLPEITDENSEAYKTGYKNICEIGKERIRRAGDKIKAELIEKQKQVSLDTENTLDPEKLDIGFRVFKLDTSNLKKWDFGYESGATVEQLTIALQAMIESIKPDRTQLDVVFEVMIKLGIDLNDTVTPIEIGGKTVYAIGPNALIMICLDQNITTAEVSEMAEYAPGNIVFADACFVDDTEMANVELLLQDKGIEMRLV